MSYQQQHARMARDLFWVPDMEQAVYAADSDGFNALSIPLAHPRFRRELVNGPEFEGPFTRSDLILGSDGWAYVVGKISEWINVDSSCDAERRNSEQALKQELAWASHLTLPAVMVSLHDKRVFNLAASLNPSLYGCASQIWARVPLTAPCYASADGESDSSPGSSPDNDPWEWWNTLRSLCVPSQKLCVALELTADLCSVERLARWAGEPVKALIFPTSIFLTNNKGYPVLSKAHQVFVRRLLQYDPTLIISGNPKHEMGITGYKSYLDHIYNTQPERNEIEKFAQGYEDLLQAPLQPLMDNLESQTYETFEKDPIKYSQYEKAVFHALQDRVPEDKRSSVTTVLMVVGAGRGPLVKRALAAADKAGCKVRVYAVEKNPNAVVTLRSLKQDLWHDRVTVVSSDMRVWEAPEKADILVSELLGSWGDNELSPECLDGAQKFLKEDGISIPSKYTSYVSPLCTPKLHNELVAQNEIKSLETMYVVMLHNCHRLADIKPVFEFDHPHPDVANVDNSRFKTVKFTIEESGEMHGFAGYFDSVLYKDVMISIHPDTHSPGMFSWFPIYIPLEHPVYLAKGSEVEVHFWRRVSRTQVWYEWALSSPVLSRIHNPRGRSSFIGL